MRGNLYYKKHVEKLIDSNPTSITIARTAKVDDGYGGDIETEITINETVTFYKKKSVRETINDSGVSPGYATTNVEKVLAKGDADIIEGDTFSTNNREYKVSFVNSYFDICKQVELGVIKNGD